MGKGRGREGIGKWSGSLEVTEAVICKLPSPPAPVRPQGLLFFMQLLDGMDATDSLLLSVCPPVMWPGSGNPSVLTGDEGEEQRDERQNDGGGWGRRERRGVRDA